VLITTLIITIVIFIGSFFYYGNINSAEDPRVFQARKLLQRYEKQLEENQAGLAMALLEEMEQIYRSTPGYEKSYEVGVVLNNKATVYLVQIETQILEKAEIDRGEMLAGLDTAESFTQEALLIYKNWLEEMGDLQEDEIRRKLVPFFKKNDPAFHEVPVEDVLRKRVADCKLAQIETKRRMSVSLTNLGLINRYKGNLQEAKKNYEDALSLWERNYTAQDNLNMLMNVPVKKRSIVDKLFPPERKKENT
jgi:tetratricopeptide (TPR) repeat protein